MFKNDAYSIGAIVGQMCTLAKLETFELRPLFLAAFGDDEELVSILVDLLEKDHQKRLGVSELCRKVAGAQWQEAAKFVVPLLRVVYDATPGVQTEGSSRSAWLTLA